MICQSILIVEDDQAIRDALRLMLEVEGYKVKTAINGKEGVALLRENRVELPCLILLDLMMPVMNGWQFVEEMSADVMLATIPVVVVTAFGEKAESIRARQIIKKPVDYDVLLEAVRKYCGAPPPHP